MASFPRCRLLEKLQEDSDATIRGVCARPEAAVMISALCEDDPSQGELDVPPVWREEAWRVLEALRNAGVSVADHRADHWATEELDARLRLTTLVTNILSHPGRWVAYPTDSHRLHEAWTRGGRTTPRPRSPPRVVP
jgi:hypothetical protein